MKLTIEIDDDEIRRVLAPWLQLAPAAEPQSPTKLLTVREVADHLGVGRGKAYALVLSGEIQSISVGRSRRVSPAALADFISKPLAEATPTHHFQSYASHAPRRQPPEAEPSSAGARQPRRGRAKKPSQIDLSARPASPHGPKFSEDEWEAFVRSLLEQGWLPDVVDQIQDDRRDGIERAYVLTINDTARYLGLSRYGVEKLIADGKLRLFTIAPTYRGEKPSRRVPAKDVLAVK